MKIITISEGELKDRSIAIVERKDFQSLFDALTGRGYQVSGPTLRDNAVIYDNISTVEDLPSGWKDNQDAGRYRLEKSERPTLFEYVVGPQSWKKFLYPAEHTFLEAKNRRRRLLSGFVPVNSRRWRSMTGFLARENTPPHHTGCGARTFLSRPLTACAPAAPVFVLP